MPAAAQLPDIQRPQHGRRMEVDMKARSPLHHGEHKRPKLSNGSYTGQRNSTCPQRPPSASTAQMSDGHEQEHAKRLVPQARHRCTHAYTSTSAVKVQKKGTVVVTAVLAQRPRVV